MEENLWSREKKQREKQRAAQRIWESGATCFHAGSQNRQAKILQGTTQWNIGVNSSVCFSEGNKINTRC